MMSVLHYKEINEEKKISHAPKVIFYSLIVRALLPSVGEKQCPECVNLETPKGFSSSIGNSFTSHHHILHNLSVKFY